MAPDVRTAEGTVTFSVRVLPGARREQVVGAHGDAIKIALLAPAVEGKANDALTRYLSNLLDVSRLSIEIVAGHTSQSKVVRVIGITAPQLQAKLMPTEAA